MVSINGNREKAFKNASQFYKAPSFDNIVTCLKSRSLIIIFRLIFLESLHKL